MDIQNNRHENNGAVSWDDQVSSTMIIDGFAASKVLWLLHYPGRVYGGKVVIELPLPEKSGTLTQTSELSKVSYQKTWLTSTLEPAAGVWLDSLEQLITA